MKTNFSVVVFATYLSLAALSRAEVIAVDPALPPYVPVSPALSGSLTVAGSGLAPLVERLFKIYRGAHPGVTCVVIAAGDHGELPRLHESGALLVGSRVQPTDAEREAFYAKAAAAPLVIPAGKCAYDMKSGALNALGICVHKDNPLTSLTRDQVDAIFSRTIHGGYPTPVTFWGQVGVTGALANHAIDLYGYPLLSTRTTAFSHQALHDGKLKQEMTPVQNKKFIATFVAADPDGIGFFDTSLGVPGVKVLPISTAPGDEPAAPTLANIQSNKYPYYRGNYFYAVAATEDEPMNPLAREFLRLLLSREGQTAAAESGIVPMKADEVRMLLALFNY